VGGRRRGSSPPAAGAAAEEAAAAAELCSRAAPAARGRGGRCGLPGGGPPRTLAAEHHGYQQRLHGRHPWPGGGQPRGQGGRRSRWVHCVPHLVQAAHADMRARRPHAPTDTPHTTSLAGSLGSRGLLAMRQPAPAAHRSALDPPPQARTRTP